MFKLNTREKNLNILSLALIFIQSILLIYVNYRMIIISTMILSSLLLSTKNYRIMTVIAIFIYFFGIFIIKSNKYGMNFWTYLGIQSKTSAGEQSNIIKNEKKIIEEEIVLIDNYFYIILFNTKKHFFDAKNICEPDYFLSRAYGLDDYDITKKFYAMSYFDNEFLCISYEEDQIDLIEDFEQNKIAAQLNKMKSDKQFIKLCEETRPIDFAKCTFFAFEVSKDPIMDLKLKKCKTTEEKIDHLLNTFVRISSIESTEMIVIYRPYFDVYEKFTCEPCVKINEITWI